MDVRLINPFIDATLHVLETLASTKATPGKPYVKKDGVARGDVSGVIGLSGEARGTISVSFTEKCILAIVSKMFGDEIEELNDEIKDAVGEITNMISGQARQKLEKEGRSLKGAIPSVIVGKNHSISHITTQPIIAIPFSSELGDFTIEICIED
ncbi:MAG: chemotaxis protein CheX [Deltaproteobacteria bacterium]|nr:MAG: chemotaxis protein CheX [Deltaproteobacteria bacterium]